MKTPIKCGRKTYRSRQAPRMKWRNIMQCVINNSSIMKEGESILKGSAMVGQMMGKNITKNCLGSLRYLGNTTRSLEIVSEETLCKR
jgi:hypothetical protein